MASNEDQVKPSERDFYFHAAVAGQYGVAELSWYGIDGDGCLAVFSTFGRGAIPTAAVADKALYYRVDDLFNELPEVSAAEVIADAKHDVTSWEEEARRGLYSFDYNHELAQQYCLIARPVSPRKLAELPVDVQEYLRQVQVVEACIRDVAALRPQDRLDVVSRTQRG